MRIALLLVLLLALSACGPFSVVVGPAAGDSGVGQGTSGTLSDRYHPFNSYGGGGRG